MKAIIFGADGQDGHYLSRLLEKNGLSVMGISPVNAESTANITNLDSVTRLVKNLQPAFIFHLAAFSNTKHDSIFINHEVISTGTLNILEAVKRAGSHTKVFISGSGLQFRNEDRPIKETDPFEAMDAYSLSRIHSVYTARYFRTLGINVYVGYFFNHDSPLRTPDHMTKKIADAVKRIKMGSEEKIEIGDLDAVKEYGYAGDIVNGIWTLVNQHDVLEANIATGEGYSIRDWLQACFATAGKDWKDHTIEKPGFISPYKQLVADPSLVFSLGWKPAVSFEQLAQLMMVSK